MSRPHHRVGIRDVPDDVMYKIMNMMKPHDREVLGRTWRGANRTHKEYSQHQQLKSEEHHRHAPLTEKDVLHYISVEDVGHLRRLLEQSQLQRTDKAIDGYHGFILEVGGIQSQLIPKLRKRRNVVINGPYILMWSSQEPLTHTIACLIDCTGYYKTSIYFFIADIEDSLWGERHGELELRANASEARYKRNDASTDTD